jgi:Protein of unknown function (DUF2934)
MGLKRRNPARTRLFTPPQMLAAMAAFTPAAPPAVRAPAPSPISGDDRRRMIADAAYRRAERAGFAGDPLADWLDAEREIDALLDVRKAS